MLASRAARRGLACGTTNSASYGATTVDIAAPGLSVLTLFPDGQYGLVAGGSVSCAFASGAAALIKAANPDLRGPQIRQAILATAKRVPSLQGKLSTGGRLDVAAAVNLALRPRIDLSETSVDFGTVRIAHAAERMIIVSNGGGMPLRIEDLTLRGAAGFAVKDLTCSPFPRSPRRNIRSAARAYRSSSARVYRATFSPSAPSSFFASAGDVLKHSLLDAL